MPCKCIGGVDVIIYSLAGSTEGRQAMQFFDRKGIPHEDLNVSTNVEARRQMQDLSGQSDRPVILVNDRVFIGFDPAELEPFVPSFF